MHIADITRMAAVAGAEFLRRAFEQKHAGAGAARRNRGAESRIAAANDEHVASSARIDHEEAILPKQCHWRVGMPRSQIRKKTVYTRAALRCSMLACCHCSPPYVLASHPVKRMTIDDRGMPR